MRADKVKLILFELENHAIIKDIYNKDIMSIDMTNSDFIGIIGDNGSGKSTIINEMSPIAIYGNYIPRMIGKKRLVYANSKYTYDLRYIFEPNNDDKHSCKCYFDITDKDTGVIEEVNPTGSFDNMGKLVENYLGINKSILQLFDLSYKSIFLVDMTAGERLEYIQNILPGLKEIKKTASIVNVKLNTLNKIIKANENKLSRMNTKEYIADTICDVEDTIRGLESQLQEVHKLKDKYDEIVMNIRNEKYNISYIENNIRIVSDIVAHMSMSDISSLIDDDTSIRSILDKCNTNSEALSAMISKLENDLSRIEVDLSLVDVDTNINVDDGEFEVLEDMFKNIGRVETHEIANYDETNLTVLSKNLQSLAVLSATYMGADIDIDEVSKMANGIARDGDYYVIKQIADLRIEKDNLAIEKENILGEIAKIKVVNDILGTDFKKNTLCNTCGILKKLENISDDIDILLDRIKYIDIQSQKILDDMVHVTLLHKHAKTYSDDLLKYEPMTYIAKNYLEDYDFIKYMKNIYLINEAITKVNYMVTMKRNLNTYNKMQEINKLNKAINDNEVDYASLKTSQSMIIDKLKELYNSKKDIETTITKLTKIMAQYAELNYIYLPKKSLRDELSNMRVEKDKLVSNVHELEAVISTLTFDSLSTLTDRLTKDKAYRDKLMSELVLRDNLVEEIKRYSILQLDIAAVHMTLSSSLVTKVAKWFMINLRDYTNKLLSERQLPYKIAKIVITDKEFRIPVLNEITSREVHDISKVSSGEKALTGTSLVFASHNLLDIPYDIMKLDEVDALLSDANRRKYIENLMALVARENKQVIAISHNGNFSMYGDIHLIAMRGAIKNNSNNIIYDAVV